MNVNNDTEERYHHSLPIQIRFNDVDRYGHVNNNSYFAYYDLGKEEYLRNVLKVDYRKAEVVPVIANINADFIQPIFYGDEIVIETRVSHIGQKSFTLKQRAINQKQDALFVNVARLWYALILPLKLQPNCLHLIAKLLLNMKPQNKGWF